MNPYDHRNKYAHRDREGARNLGCAVLLVLAAGAALLAITVRCLIP